MKVKVEDLKDSQKLIRVEVEPERVDAVLEDVYSEIQKRAHIPGFRVGKAPRDLLEKHHSDTADNETINRLVWECYREAVLQQKLQPVGYPVIEDVNFNKGKPLIFTVKVDVRPQFKLKSYRGLKIKEEPVAVTDEDVNLGLSQLQESTAVYKNIDDRPIAKGDYIVCDYESFVDGKLVDKRNNLWLYISDQLQPNQLLAALLGAGKDATKEVEVTHPKDYQHKELAGKTAVYKITPREIKEKILPEINDELAKTVGSFKDLEDLKRHLRENILKAKEDQKRRNLEDQIYESLLKNHNFDVPLSMVETQTERLLEDTKLKLLYQGYKKEDLDKEDENLKKSLYQKAQESVRLFFIIEDIASKENIGISQKELDDRIQLIAIHTKQDPKEVTKKMEDNRLMDDLRQQILHDKVAEFLLKEASRE